MATKLKNMHLTSVDLVRAGANQEADICLYKSAEPTEQPTERETNILKRFIRWLTENPAEAQQEPAAPVEKGDDPAEIYKSAITESIQSIAADDSISAEEKNDMIAKSIDQYHDAMVDLFSVGKSADDGLSYITDDLDNPLEYEEEVEKSAPDYDEIEEV